MADKKISELTTASEIKNGDNIELSQDTGSGLVSLKATILAIANKMLKGINYTSDLQTTDKTVIGAINEVAQGGGGGSSTLDGLNDVDIDDTTLADGQALVYNGTSEKWENGQGGGGTGGHTIINENGTSMTARSGLQFFGAVEVTDDNANNRTLVEVLGGDFYNPVIYSTEEREIGVWTDGKPLYQKTFVYANIPSLTNGMTFQTDLSNIDNSQISGFVSEGATTYNFPYVGNNKGMGFIFNKSSNEFVAQGNDSFSNANLVIHIQYTKTTDVAGSGTWTPQGVPAVHYSTDEQIIGTWVDGSTLYEKTLAIPSLSAGSNTIQHNIANFDKMISCQGRINYDGDDLVVPYMQTQVTSGFIAYGIGISNFNSTRYFIILGNMFDVSKFSGGYVTVRYTKSS